MRSRLNSLRVTLGIGLGLAFFGCVGLPRRRPPADDLPRATTNHPGADPVARMPREPETIPDSLRIPGDAPARPSDPIMPVSGSDSPPPLDPPPGPPVRPMPPPDPPPSIRSPTVSPTEATTLAALRQIHQKAVAQYASMDSYIVRFTRREFFKGKMQPEEVMVLKFRKEPWSVYFKWIGQEGRGREALFVKGQHESKIHTLLAAGDVPLMPAGKRMSFELDSILVRSSSRHPVSSAGIGNLIERLAEVLNAMERRDARYGTATPLGRQKRTEFSQPLETVEWTIPPGLEPTLPKGGRRWCFFDSENNLPALLITHDEQGHEVEYYRYDRFQFPVALDDDDFNPDRLWPKPKR